MTATIQPQPPQLPQGPSVTLEETSPPNEFARILQTVSRNIAPTPPEAAERLDGQGSSTRTGAQRTSSPAGSEPISVGDITIAGGPAQAPGHSNQPSFTTQVGGDLTISGPRHVERTNVDEVAVGRGRPLTAEPSDAHDLLPQAGDDPSSPMPPDAAPVGVTDVPVDRGHAQTAERFNEHGFFRQAGDKPTQSILPRPRPIGVVDVALRGAGGPTASTAVPADQTEPSPNARTLAMSRAGGILSTSSSPVRGPSAAASPFPAASEPIAGESAPTSEEPLQEDAGERASRATLRQTMDEGVRTLATVKLLAVAEGRLSPAEREEIERRLSTFARDEGLADAELLINGVPIAKRRNRK